MQWCQKITSQDYCSAKFENNKPCLFLLWRSIQTLLNVKKLAKSGVPYIPILDITGGIYYSSWFFQPENGLFFKFLYLKKEKWPIIVGLKLLISAVFFLGNACDITMGWNIFCRSIVIFMRFSFSCHITIAKPMEIRYTLIKAYSVDILMG